MQIPDSHPALPGHFPGSAVVPGVVLLDVVLTALKSHKGSAVIVLSLPSVKFISPVLPGQDFDVEFADKSDDTTGFTVTSGGQSVMSGSIKYRI